MGKEAQGNINPIIKSTYFLASLFLGADLVSSHSVYISKTDVVSFDIRKDLFYLDGPINPQASYRVSNSGGSITSFIETQIGSLEKDSNLNTCNSFKLIPLNNTQGDQQYKFVGLFNNRKTLAEGVVTYKEGEGETPGTLQFSKLNKIQSTMNPVKLWGYGSFYENSYDEYLTVLVAANDFGSLIRFYWTLNSQLPSSVSIPSPGNMVTNEKKFPTQNVRLRSFNFNPEESTIIGLKIAFEENIRTSSTKSATYSPFIVYSNFLQNNNPKLIQGVVDLTQIAGLEDLRHLKDFRIHQTGKDKESMVNTAVITYEESGYPDIQISCCDTIINETRNLTFSNCRKISLPNERVYTITKGSYTSVVDGEGTEASKVLIYGFNANSGRIVLFDFDAETGELLKTKLQSACPVLKSDQVFNRMEVSTDINGHRHIEIYFSSESTKSDSIVLFDLKVKNDDDGVPSYLSFKQISDRESTALSVGHLNSKTQVVSIKKSGFSVFMESETLYLQIFGGSIPVDQSTLITIFRAIDGGGTKTANVNLTVLEKMNDLYDYLGTTNVSQVYLSG